MTCKVLRRFANILAADERYSLLNRDNLRRPTHMQLSQKQKTFSQFIAAFLKGTLNFDYIKFSKKDDPHN